MFTTRPTLRLKPRLTRLIMIFCVLAFGANLLYTASLKTSSRHLAKVANSETATKASEGKQVPWTKISEAMFSPTESLPTLAPPTPLTSETIATYAYDSMSNQCTATPKSAFVLGDTVCVKVTGLDPDFPRSVTLTNAGGIVIARNDLSTDTSTFLLPTSESDVFYDNVNVDNRGVWHVNLVPLGRYVVRASASFTLSSTNKAANLGVYNVVTDPIEDLAAGSNVTVGLTVFNQGPDAVPDVQVTELVPSNATFASAGPDPAGFSCTHPTVGSTGASVCTASNVPSGTIAQFTFVYSVNSGVPVGTVIASTASVGQIASPTTVVSDLNAKDNQWTARAAVSSNPNTPTGCVLACPENIITTANTMQGTQSGAIVTFDAAEPGGTCGTITASPASGTFFPVGTTTVTSTSGEGGGSCSFTVTVVETPAPTISCPADQTAQATGSQLEVAVNLNAPTTTGSGVRVDGTRSDNRDLSDPFPVGTTIVTWTATETFTDPNTSTTTDGRSVSCKQKVIVTSSSAPTISCPGDRTFNASGCSTTLTAAQIGTPNYTGSNVTLTGTRSDSLDLTDPFSAGQTRITWTATDDIGRVASCVETITITSTGGGDTTPPTLSVPPDVTTTTSSCSALLDDELGIATADDNCSASVSITRTGIPVDAHGQPTFIFPVGTTIITYTATDAAGNHTIGTQRVTVRESTPPTIAAPADVVLNTGPGATSCGLTVSDLDATLGTATANDNCAGVTWARSNVPAGNNFPVGDTIVTYTATDASGNTASANQKVTVVDNTAPVAHAPLDVTLYTGTNATSCGVTVSDLDGTLGTATASDNCPGATAARTGGVPAGNNFPVGDTIITYTATDAHNNTATATQKVTVIDNTAPTITAPANKTFYTGANATSCSVTVSDSDLGSATASDNCPGVTVTRDGGNVFPLGNTTVTYTAHDAHGNTSTATQTVTVIDNTPPVVAKPADITVYLPLNTTATSMAVTYPNPLTTATDNCAGTIQITANPISGSTFSVGPHTVTVTATDAHNNSAQTTFTVTVLYDFSGFFSPINNQPTVNIVKAGSAVPVKFSLSGNKGLSIFAASSPTSAAINCTTDQAIDISQTTVTAGGSSLSYDATSDQYVYTWKTDSSWAAGTCRQLVVTLNDGSQHVANFKFK
jgi:hypothetical protein